jgi:hypothetical protein
MAQKDPLIKEAVLLLRPAIDLVVSVPLTQGGELW